MNTTEERKETRYNTLIGIKGETVYFLDYTFVDGDFKGAVGTTYAPVSANQVSHYRSLKYAKEFLLDSFSREEIKERFDTIKKGVRSVMFDFKNNSDCDFIGHDAGDSRDPIISEQLKLLGKEQVGIIPKVWECIGGGRVFDKDLTFDILVNPTLLEKVIKEFEG